MLGLIGSWLYNHIRAPKKQEVAFLIDQTGLEERLSTALMLIEDETTLGKLQREDTINCIKGYSLKEHFPMKVSGKKLGVNIILMVACMILFMIPTKAKLIEQTIRAFEKEKKAVSTQVEKQKELIEKENVLSQVEKEELTQLLDKTLKEIPKAKDGKEMDKAMERLFKKLENEANKIENKKAQETVNQMNKTLTESFQKKAKEEAKQDLKALKEGFSKNELTKAIAQSIDSNQENELQESIEELKEQVETLNEKEKQALAQAMANIAQTMNNDQLASSLNQASHNIMSGTLNTSQLKGALTQIKQLASGSNSPSNSPNENAQGSNNANSSQGNQNKGNSQNGNNGGNSGQGGGKGNNGSNSSQGSGKGNGQGWNKGSDHGKEKAPDGNEGDYQDNLGKQSNLLGEIENQDNIEQTEIAYGINIAGKKVDYHSVVGEYTDEALENIDSVAVPEDMKEMIKDYFEAINES